MTTNNYSEEDVKKLVNDAIEKAYDYFRQRKFEIVCVTTEHILKIDTENINAMQLLGLSYSALSRHDDAISTLVKCLSLNPSSAESLNDLALAYSNSGKYEKAIDYLKQAIKAKPEMAVLHSNLGLQYRHGKDYERALSHYEDALKIKREPTTLAMIGGCYGELKMLDLAEKYIREAIELKPDFAAAHVDLASVLKLTGRWMEGFAEYEWRYDVYDQLQIWKKIYDPRKKYTGGELEGKRIIAHSEQGHGDAIQFVRYASILKEKGAYVIIHCAETLKPIFEKLADEIFTTEPNHIKSSDELPEHDYHVSLLSLPHIFQTIRLFQSYIDVHGSFNFNEYSECKIGIVWAGNPQHPNDKQRSCKLEYFKNIAQIPNVKLFSLMKDTRPRKYCNDDRVYDLTENCENMGVIDLSEHIYDFGDTARIIKSLDLIVGVDTAVIHLAAAMGKPCINLLSWNPDWRWEIDGDVSIWYTSMHILRQKQKDNWESVFTEAEAIIRNFARE